MTKQPELIVFSNFRIGGMKSYYENILSHFPSENFFKIKWYLVDYTFDQDAPRPEKVPSIVPSETFNFTPEDSIYSAAQRLSKVINNSPGVVITNSELELATLHLYRRPSKTIIFVCHDDLYIPIAKKFEFLIDVFIAHNWHYFEKLNELFPSRINDIKFIPYGVKIPSHKRHINKDKSLGIILVSRLYESKGVRDLPEIDKILKQKSIHVKWTIVGNGPERKYLLEKFSGVPDVTFTAPQENEEVLNEIQKNDIFILPSRLDGLPVALLESMSIGCVPIISEFNPGIRKVVTVNEGFVLEIGNNTDFANKIQLLNSDRNFLEQLSNNCRNKIEQEYNIIYRAEEYYNFFQICLEKKRKTKITFIRYGGYLDFPIIPDGIRKFIRKLLNKIR